MAIFGTLGEIDLSAISASVSDTAVDVFVYDTSKDSDGGAWRKRTQSTSWYNETLNTATRGSRKDFPAVAVIVAESLKVTIYDGDDPDLPMWMVFNGTPGGASHNLIFSSGTFCLSAMNGTVFMGAVAIYVNFISEYSRGHRFLSPLLYWNGPYNGNIAERNAGKGSTKLSDKLILGGSTDVAMTVLPNAPIDSATGLPIPTIAVGTDGGASIIRDDGTVVDITITAGSNYDVEHIDFTDDNRVVILWNAGGGEITIDDIPSADISANYPINLPGSYYNDHSPANYSPVFLTEGPSLSNRIPAAIQQFRAVGTTAALSLFDENKESEEDGMVAFISSSYNTGYQQGIIKGAFLSDTDATNVTSSNLMSGATYNSSERITSYSYTAGSDTIVIDDDEATVDGYVNLTLGGLSPSTKYVISYVTDNTYTPTAGFNPHIGNTSVGTSYFDSAQTGSGQGSMTFTTASSGDPTLVLYSNYSGGNLTYTINLRLAEEDRSANNKGLQVFGTITKSAVATGAELVGYSGFSNSTNFLRQPHNEDYNVGTGDFYIMCWVKGNQLMLWQRKGGGSLDMRCEFPTSGGNANKPRFLMSNGSVSIDFSATQAFDTTTWHHCVWVKRGARRGELYIDGELDNSLDIISDLGLNENGSNFTIGARADNGGEVFNGSISLFRIGASAPSAEQIKKIYEDEKFLFQENAACTLYGSSDAVTALAFDDTTNLLHVGTSAGRSEFQGLRRINNTTTAVTTAISAHDSLIIEQ